MAGSVTHWWERDTTPGYALLAATALSFALLNSPIGEAFHHLLEDPLLLGASLHLVINDALMAVFFLYVGLELKREFLEGPLRDPRAAALPVAAALGGMAAPAAIFLAIAGGPGFADGWAIPVATDIAFAVGALSLVGTRAPAGLRLFLLTLAIVDDLGAIVVIAVFYTETIAAWALGGAALVFAGMLAMNRWGVHRLWPYWLAAAALWAFMLQSGVHATIAGVLAAMAVPLRAPSGESPLVAAEHALKPWVQLAIMPIFALANAGVSLAGLGVEVFEHPVTLGAGFGLLIGKPLGIMLATILVAALLKRALPCSPRALFGLALLAGIGFTMSLFIGGLAFSDPALGAPVRVGVLTGSFVAAALGLLILSVGGRENADPQLALDEDDAERKGVLETKD